MTAPLWQERVRSALRSQAAYHVPAAAGAIKLDANESPFDLSAAAQADLAVALADPALHRYPDAAASELRAVLARRLGVAGDEISLGNGSDELIGLLCAAFGEPRDGRPARLMYPAPGFVVFKTAALAHGMEPAEVPLGEAFAPNEAALLAAVARDRPSVVIVATPNNPTGTVWPHDTIARLLDAHPDVITVVDEAYLAYADAPSFVPAARAWPHALVMGTLSKIGLAGLRVGYVVGHRELIAEIEKVRPPYNLNTLSQRAATVMIERHAAELDGHAAGVRRERERLRDELRARRVEVFPSQANFLLVRVADSRAVFDGLLARGVLVRRFSGGRLDGCLRITVGTAAENQRLLTALEGLT